MIQDQKTLDPAERKKTADALVAICANDEAMKERCAPGGCSRLDVTRADGTQTHMEDTDTVTKVMAVLLPYFPALRTK